MKRIFTLFLLSFCFLPSQGQLLVEDFNFTGDLGSNGWAIHSGTAEPVTTTTGLTFPGYSGSGIGNAANVVGAGYDYNRGFANQSGNGTIIWMSAMLRVTDMAANTGGYFLHLGDRSDTDPTSFTQFSARVFAKTDANGVVNFGISNSATATYGTTNFTINTTYLAVVRYTINILGNDEVALWILSGNTPTDEASLGTPEVLNTTTAGQDNIDAVAIRQAASIPDVIVDGIRVGNSFTNSVLPLNLTSFKASLNTNAVDLNWTSLNEQNVNGFVVERSADGRTYAAIGQLSANNGNNSSYAFTDKSPATGTNYYRLKMTDKDGAVRYSTVIIISNGTGLKAQIFPNPTFGNISVSHSKATKGAAIRILNAEGKQLKTYPVEAGAIQTSLTVGELLKGNYVLIFENDGERTTTKFVKQ